MCAYVIFSRKTAEKCTYQAHIFNLCMLDIYFILLCVCVCACIFPYLCYSLCIYSPCCCLLFSVIQMQVRVTFLHKMARKTGRAADGDTLKEVGQNALLCLSLSLCVCERSVVHVSKKE